MKRNLPAIIGAAGLLLLLVVVGMLTQGEYAPVAGRVYSGVVVYTGAGDTHTPAFTIISGDKAGTTLLVEYPDGQREVKDRAAIVGNQSLKVKTDDTALAAMRWETTD